MKEIEKINVLNYNENRVSVEVAPGKSYIFEASEDGKRPTVIPMTMDEIRYANNYNAFKMGMLFFDKDVEEEVYKALNITDWQNILTNDDLRDIILHPTFDGLSKILAIKDSSTFERVRGAYQKLKATGTFDVSERVAQIIDARYKELLNRKLNTSIELTKVDIASEVQSAQVDELKEQNAAMQQQIAEMQKMIADMQANNSALKTPAKTATTTSKTTAKRTAGRPKKTT